jgi:hypothetical protein
MQRTFMCIWLGLGLGLGAALAVLPRDVQAETSVRVLETHPAGESVTLAKGESFYLRLAYASDTPVRIWAQPYFRGEPASAGSNPSGSYAGQGEALGWFFFFEAGAEVDEVQIRAGDGSRGGTQLVARDPVHAIASDRPAAARARPAWVAELEQKSQAEQRAAAERAAATPTSPADVVLFGVLGCAFLAIALGGIAAPLWGVWRFRGGFRVAALLPLALLGFVVLRIAVDVARDSTSHNLWPFEIAQVGALSLILMGALGLVRRLSGRAP